MTQVMIQLEEMSCPKNCIKSVRTLGFLYLRLF